MSAIAASVAARAPRTRLRRVRRFSFIALLAALLGTTAGTMAASGRAWEAILLVGLVLPAMLWRQPQVGPVIIFGAALLIEQFPVNISNYGSVAIANVPITNSVPLFHGLGSYHLEPADLMLIAAMLVYMVRTSSDGTRWWPRSQVSLGMFGLAGALLYGEVLGLAHHGQMRESFTELRPFVYLILTYLLTSVLIRSRSAIQAMMWTLVVAETIKSIQGMYLWIATRSFVPEPQSLLAHEEAMFTSLFLFLVLGLWLFDMRGRLRTVSTWLVPLVLCADLVNDRRTSWLIIGGGFVVMLVVTYSVRPDRRRLIRRIAIVTGVISALYFPAFWNDAGSLGQPAAGLKSAIGTPDARDQLSDDYRIQEQANLELNLKNAGPAGVGFGIEINYALPMPGLVNKIDPEIMYVPHNGVWYILMRMGLIGGIAFWCLVAAAILQACRVARCPDPRIAITGLIAAAAVVGWTLEGATDQGFILLRVAFAMGCVIGLTEAARHIYTSERPTFRWSGPSTPPEPVLDQVPLIGVN